MRACILDSITKEVKNVIILNCNPQDFVPYEPGTELAPRNDGEIGWIWTGTDWDLSNITKPLEYTERQRRNKYLNLYIDTINPVRWDSLTQQKRDEFILYRQELLDVPQQVGFPTNITWPTPPEL